MTIRRARGLYDRMTTFQSLYAAARLARRGKRRAYGTARFEHHLEENLVQLQSELRAGQFTFGGYRTFIVDSPTRRVIRAAPYRDRVVHHAMCAQLEPLLERRMIEHSFACRVGKGSHAAIINLQEFLRGGAWALKIDISKYFYSVDHDLLRQSLGRVTDDSTLLRLVTNLLATYDASAEYYFPQPGDDLFAVAQPRGLPIGNLSSQLFANWYLDPIDQYIKRTLGWRRYVRYMDDLVLVGATKAEVTEARAKVQEALSALRLTPHPRKTQIFPVANGVPFLGFRVYPHGRRILRANLRRFTVRMRRYAHAVADGTMPLDYVRASLRSWLGFADPAMHGALIEHILDTIYYHEPGRRLPTRFTLRTA